MAACAEGVPNSPPGTATSQTAGRGPRPPAAKIPTSAPVPLTSQDCRAAACPLGRAIRTAALCTRGQIPRLETTYGSAPPLTKDEAGTCAAVHVPTEGSPTAHVTRRKPRRTPHELPPPHGGRAARRSPVNSSKTLSISRFSGASLALLRRGGCGRVARHGERPEIVLLRPGLQGVVITLDLLRAPTPRPRTRTLHANLLAARQARACAVGSSSCAQPRLPSNRGCRATSFDLRRPGPERPP